MKKIKLAQGSWLEINNNTYNPGDEVEADDKIAAELIAGGSATEIILMEVDDNANINT